MTTSPTFPLDVQTALQAVRKTINAAVPRREGVDQLPDSNVQHRWGGQSSTLPVGKKPISPYPGSHLDEALEQQVDPYLSGRSTAKFALTKPIPRISWRSMKTRVVTSRRQLSRCASPPSCRSVRETDR